MRMHRVRNSSGAIRHESRATRAPAFSGHKEGDATGDVEAAMTVATGETAGEGVLNAAADTGTTGDTSVADTLRSAARN